MGVPLSSLGLRVPKQLAYDGQRNAFGDQHRGIRVPEVMHPETIEARLFRECAPEAVEVRKRFARNLAGKQIARPSALLPHLLEQRQSVRVQRDVVKLL